MRRFESDRLLAARVLREECAAAGFVGFGIARAGTPPRFERFREWIAEGRHAGMRYLEETLPVRESPSAVLPGARAVVCLSLPHPAAPRVAGDGARFARYAETTPRADYHETLR